MSSGVRIRNNIQILFNGQDVSSYITSASLVANVEAIPIASLQTGTAGRKISGMGDWESILSGKWEPGLDNVFGAAVSSAQNQVNFEFVIGESGAQVSYAWTAKAFVQQYKAQADEWDDWLFNARICLSGAPERTSD